MSPDRVAEILTLLREHADHTVLPGPWGPIIHELLAEVEKVHDVRAALLMREVELSGLEERVNRAQVERDYALALSSDLMRQITALRAEREAPRATTRDAARVGRPIPTALLRALSREDQEMLHKWLDEKETLAERIRIRKRLRELGWKIDWALIFMKEGEGQ